LPITIVKKRRFFYDTKASEGRSSFARNRMGKDDFMAIPAGEQHGARRELCAEVGDGVKG
jgi:hypothetical protein